MLVYPNAKINLGLFVTEKRSDGYHNLETIFVPVPWYDALEVIPSDIVALQISGASIEGNPEDNLILKVYRKMQAEFGLKPVKILLHKNIPMGAGLGGGSADAAFTAKLLNQYFQLQLPDEKLEDIVRPLGSDCAFFIRNKTTFAFGKGDQFEAIDDCSKGKFIVLVYPNIHVSTALAYAGVQPQKPEISLKESVLQPISTWRSNIRNDFEKSVFEKFPEIEKIKLALYDQGAVYASMSGSGSAVFGIFDHEIKPEFPKTYRIQSGYL